MALFTKRTTTRKTVSCRVLRDVGKVQCGGWREDVGVVLGARLLKAMKRRVTVILSEALVLMSLAWQLNGRVFG